MSIQIPACYRQGSGINLYWCIWCCSEFGETDSDPMTFHFRFGSLHFAGLEIFDMMIASSHPRDDFRTILRSHKESIEFKRNAGE